MKCVDRTGNDALIEINTSITHGEL